jgi:cysteinyl-tRNA synthetase
VFRLYDTRTGQAEEIDPGPGRLLRLYAFGPAGRRPAHPGDLRPLLLADLIRRNAEHRHNLSVLTCLVTDDDDAFRADATALSIRPAEQTVGASERAGAAADLRGPGELIVDGRARHSVRAGPVTFDGRDAAAAAVRVSDLAERGLDPLALRLTFLSRRPGEQQDLTWDALAGADQALRRWRELVAEWAESPSKPMCAEVTAQFGAAFDDDLDTSAALRALDQLARDPEIPPGSKFESFMNADRLLGLDLPSEIGRPRRDRAPAPRPQPG